MNSQEESGTPGTPCCCSPTAKSPSEDPACCGPAVVARIFSNLTLADRLGGAKVRWRVGRGSYTVLPGLYALGDPGPESPVLVSANYKLSFDGLRHSLAGIDGWILVLDTRGINVWCAAGKGTFGTAELVKQVADSRLSLAVTHRRLIVPQLGAPGVAAHDVLKATGFRVTYGPVRAQDLPEFLSAGMTATPEMRRVRFPLVERMKVAPVDFIGALKTAFLMSVALVILSALGTDGFNFQRMLAVGPASALLVLLTTTAAAFLAPALLPWLPGRPFALKGLWLGLVLAACGWWLAQSIPVLAPQKVGNVGWLFMLTALTSYITMNYTGTSTYTSLSGVLKEMRIAVPLQGAVALVGYCFWFAGRFI